MENANNLTFEQKRYRRRIIEISHKFHLSHLGSCLTTVDLIDAVFQVKKPNERFVLSNGHAGIALYIILEKYGLISADFFNDVCVHPDRNIKAGIDVSTGSLGQGLPIALGMALADKKKNVYCVISDGECNEGSIWEALRITGDMRIKNLKILVNANGWGAYGGIPLKQLAKRLKSFGFKLVTVNGHSCREIADSLKMKVKDKPLLIFAQTDVGQLPFLKGLDAHYYVMDEEDYKKALEYLA